MTKARTVKGSGGWRSGQSHQTVNLAPEGYGGSNPPPPMYNVIKECAKRPPGGTLKISKCPRSSAVEHVHGKDGVKSSILFEGFIIRVLGVLSGKE